MNLALDKRGEETSWTVSIVVHVLLVLAVALQTTAPLPKPKILTVETVSGVITPRGEGSGAPGRGQAISDQAPPSPLALAMNMNLAAIKVPPREVKPVEQAPPVAPKPKPVPEQPKPDLQKERAENAFPDLRAERPADEAPVEGLGSGMRAGTSKGAPDITGPIAGRRYSHLDWKYPKRLPEETRLVLQIVVKPSGLVSSALVTRNSGFREIDEYYLGLARDMIFDPLPSGVEQVDEVGEITVKLQYGE